jgi:hypothetical protein
MICTRRCLRGSDPVLCPAVVDLQEKASHASGSAGFQKPAIG